MNIPFVDLGAQYQLIKTEIDDVISKVLDQNIFIGGDWVSNFEKHFAAYLDVANCVSCANGTDAIEIALEALGVGEGDEVLVPAYTWMSTASAVSRVGAKPVFVDIHPDFYTMDVSKIEAKLTKHTKVILPVHFYGLPVDMNQIMTIAKKHNLYVIEDCAQAHGASINGQKVGSFGNISTFSFFPGKNLGAYGDGGAIVTNSSDLADKAMVIARLGQRGKHNHVAIGRNSRLDSLHAAILDVKLKHLDNWISQRQRVANWYFESLKNVFVKLPFSPSGFNHAFHLFVIQADRRDELKVYLEQKGISTQIHYPKPLHQLGVFDEQGSFSVTEAMSSKLLSLPMYPELSKEEVEYVADAIREFYI